MNQIFKITVGQDTIKGVLPSIRVGQGYCSLFHISGVDGGDTAEPPKIWVTIGEDSFFWTCQWINGLWQCIVNDDPTRKTGIKDYAITVGGGADESGKTNPEFLVGQGKFVVYPNIAGSSGGEGGEPGESVSGRIDSLDSRLIVVEGIIGTLPDMNNYVTKEQLSSGAEAIQSMPTDTPAQREARMVALLNMLFDLE